MHAGNRFTKEGITIEVLNYFSKFDLLNNNKGLIEAGAAVCFAHSCFSPAHINVVLIDPS